MYIKPAMKTMGMGRQPSFDGVSYPLIPEPVILPKNSNEKWFEN